MWTVQTANERANHLSLDKDYKQCAAKKKGWNLHAEIITKSFSLGSLFNDRLRLCKLSKCHFTMDFKVSKLNCVPNETISILLKKMKCWEMEVWEENTLMNQKFKKELQFWH